MGRRGTNQTKAVCLSVPDGSLDYWQRRLAEAGLEVVEDERFGEKVLCFAHPCGIEYELVAGRNGKSSAENLKLVG